MSERRPTKSDSGIVRLRGGQNCPVYRNQEQKAEVLKGLIGEAMEIAIEEGYSPGDLNIKTDYYSGRTEPHTSHAEVTVSYRYG